jgi:carbonic anhydrase/acetyltransferase-like protein (isoleucine patch superfamily)
MIIHPIGGGLVAETATVHPTAFVGSDCEVLDNAVVGEKCTVSDGSVIFGNAILQNRSIVRDGAKVGGIAFLNATTIHGNVTLTKTPITIHGFEQEIVITDDFIIVGCQTIDIKEWETRSLALLRANGFPKLSAERIRDTIDVIYRCHKTLYHEADLKKVYNYTCDETKRNRHDYQ